jgi:DMSO/TMAO reductase YedYZ molybdopterin-dependent catalytic subunit
MDRVLQPPQVGPPGWRLAVDGAVRTPLSLDYATLLALPRHNRYVTMECVDNPVGGPMISTALWTGVSVANLLRAAGAAGDTLVFHGSDVYAESVPRAEVEAVGGMVTYAMNGEALAPEHGYPARFLLPGVYGFKSVKWLERVEVRHGGIEGSWHSQGWTETGQIRTTTRIDVARRRGDVILLAGIAFAGTRGVRAVELRVNGGPWRRATLGRALSSATWVQWTARLSAPGPATVEARAVDRLGQVQTERAHGSYPDGATGWASVAV